MVDPGRAGACANLPSGSSICATNTGGMGGRPLGFGHQLPPQLSVGQRGGGAGTCLSGGGGGPGEGVRGSRGEPPPPPVGTYLVHREQKIYWATNHSAHGNVILLVANKTNSSLQVNSGFPHLIKTQQIQQSGTFTISGQLTVIMVNQN